MFLIAGLATRRKTVEAGQFFCPTEQGTRHYQHLQQRRWFTLFFIPLIPLGGTGEWLQCQSCGATYEPGILQQFPASYQG